jgi:pyridoxal phosphate enzyme (YggS family)
MNFINNYLSILENIKSISKKTTLVVVTKNQEFENILPLIKIGHRHFGENRVQEAKLKWHNKSIDNLNLHLIGRLQSNKSDLAVEIFNYIHSLDSEKLAFALSKSEKKLKKKINYFIQVNIANEPQKGGILANELKSFCNFCKHDLYLNIIGLMIIPPANDDSIFYFKRLKDLSINNNLPDLSMGMSNDYIQALNNGSTFIRVGSLIFKS